MTISATNQGLRPGVCTSSNRPSSPFAGQLIFETDTNRLAVWNGTAWIVLADADTPPGLELVKTQTIGTAVSSVTVSDVFSSEFDNYKIIISGGAASTGLNLLMTLGSTSTAYYWSGAGHTYANAATTGASANGTSWYVGRGETSSLSLNVDLINPFVSDETSYASFTSAYSTTGFFIAVGGYLNNTTSYTAFTLTTSTGTITGGTIRVYGYRNS